MEPTANNKRFVLAVDDEKSILDVLRVWLDFEGYACKTASSAKEALDLFDQHPFELVLTDIVLPDMNGLELTKNILSSSPNTKVIVMTGFGDNFSYDSAIQAGASDFIRKPFTLQELTARMKILKMKEDLLNWAITDELTGMYNRKGFFTMADHLLKVSRRNRQGIFLLYADLDGLKDINDKYGHKEGDLALIETADILKGNYRDSDIVARIGGDEFVVAPVGRVGDSPEMISSRIEKAVAQHNQKAGIKYPISLSWGLAFFDPESPCSIDSLLMQADESMYAMKKLKKR